MLLLISTLSCRDTAPRDRGIGGGPWTLSGPEVVGELRTSEGCRLGLWGPAWGTPGTVRCTLTEDERGRWLSFPFETGLGEGTGVLELRDDGRARLPLGSRDGEHELLLALEEGSLEPAARREAAEEAAERLAGWQAAWAEGAFRLQVDEHHVGELQFSGDGLVTAATYDAHWMTEGPVRVPYASRGPDLVLVFPVMPALKGEQGLLLVNVPTARVVAPAAPEPTPLDRRFALVPGSVDEEEAIAATRAAAEAALAREREVLARLLPELTAGLEEGCEVPSGAGDLLPGYGLRVEDGDDGCALVVEPEPVQHGRRLAVRAVPGEPVSWLTRALP